MADGGKVLIIDDEAMTTEVFAHTLRLHGYEVTTALDAESGLHATLSTTFDAVLLDLVMPVIDGLEWLRRFRATPSHPTAPVAVITGHYLIADDTVRALEQLGAIVRFKPLWLEDLVAVTRTMIEGQALSNDETQRDG